MAFFQDNLGKH